MTPEHQSHAGTGTVFEVQQEAAQSMRRAMKNHTENCRAGINKMIETFLGNIAKSNDSNTREQCLPPMRR